MTARSIRFTGPREVSIRESAVPEPDPDQVLVRTTTSAVSAGTELLVYRGEVDKSMAADETLDALDGDFEYPLSYGYSAVGRVTALGEKIDEEWFDRRVFGFNPHESHFLATPESLHPLPDDLSDEAAALLSNAETAVNFALDGRPTVGECVAVFGQGVVGLLTTALLAEFPLTTLHTIDGYDRRRERSRSLGADRVYKPDADLEAHVSADGVDLAYELSGNPAALDAAIQNTGTAGRVVIGSWYGTKPVSLDLGGEFHRSRIRLQSSQVSTIDPADRGRWDKERRLREAVRLLERVDTGSLITHRFPIERAEEAYRLLDDRPEESIGVVFQY